LIQITRLKCEDNHHGSLKMLLTFYLQ